jgi:hypothetical protein
MGEAAMIRPLRRTHRWLIVALTSWLVAMAAHALFNR